jgi:UDP-glucuronate decarboxylase
MARTGTCLVAGGAGFIGAALTARLLAAGQRVVCLDDFSTGTEAAVAPFVHHPGWRLVRGDVRDPPDIAADAVWNLACPADPTVWPRDPEFVLTTAFSGTEALLRLAARHGASLFQASTSEIYGDPEQHPQPESYAGRVDCTGPRAAYEEGKRAAETLCGLARKRGQDVRVARLFNAYGPGMRADDGRVVPAFVAAARAGRALPVHGDGRQTRSFCFIDDLLDGMLALMALPAPPDGPLNLGGEDETSMLDLARLVARAAGGRVPIVHVPGRPGDPSRRRPDLSRARHLIGFAPRVGLAEGIGRMLAGHDRPALRPVQLPRQSEQGIISA